jgi:uncharacterized tellurite resistance protein B-like protein
MKQLAQRRVEFAKDKRVIHSVPGQIIAEDHLDHMIKKLVEKISIAFAATDPGEITEEAREAAVRMATAVLMTEIARADYDYDGTEFDLLLELITRHFNMSPEDAAELANEANETAEDYVSLHNFTQLLNKNLTHKEKEHVVSLLWQIAYADGRLDKYEDALVLQICDLLYVPRVRVMRLKHDAGLD